MIINTLCYLINIHLVLNNYIYKLNIKLNLHQDMLLMNKYNLNKYNLLKILINK